MSTPPHPLFFTIVIAGVALFLGLYFQRHFNVIPDLSVSNEEMTKNKNHNNNIAKIDRTGWNTWNHVAHWPDEGAAWPPARAFHDACATTRDNMMYIFGGLQGNNNNYNNKKVLNDLWRYDEFHDRWFEIVSKKNNNINNENEKEEEEDNSVPPARSHHSLVCSSNGKKLILFGGFGADGQPIQQEGEVWIYDILENEWENVRPAASNGEDRVEKHPSPRGAHQTVVIGDDMFVFGGRATRNHHHNENDNDKEEENNFDELWKFSFKTYTWLKFTPRTHEDWPRGRSSFSMVGLTGESKQIYVFGGLCNHEKNKFNNNNNNNNNQEECNDEWILNIGGDKHNDEIKWTRFETSGDTPTPRQAPHADVDIHDKLFLFGGMKKTKTTSEILDDFYVLDLKSKTWKKIAEGSYGEKTRPAPTFGHTCVQVLDKIVLFGGKVSKLESPGSSEVWEYFFSDKF